MCDHKFIRGRCIYCRIRQEFLCVVCGARVFHALSADNHPILMNAEPTDSQDGAIMYGRTAIWRTDLPRTYVVMPYGAPRYNRHVCNVKRRYQFLVRNIHTQSEYEISDENSTPENCMSYVDDDHEVIIRKRHKYIPQRGETVSQIHVDYS